MKQAMRECQYPLNLVCVMLKSFVVKYIFYCNPGGVTYNKDVIIHWLITFELYLMYTSNTFILGGSYDEEYL